MQWIILIGNESLTIDTLKRITYSGCRQVTQLENSRLVVDYGSDHIFYDFMDKLIDDYTEEELRLIPFKNPNFIMMTFTAKERLIQVLRLGNFPADLYIDDDQGHIMELRKYVESVEKGGI